MALRILNLTLKRLKPAGDGQWRGLWSLHVRVLFKPLKRRKKARGAISTIPEFLPFANVLRQCVRSASRREQNLNHEPSISRRLLLATFPMLAFQAQFAGKFEVKAPPNRSAGFFSTVRTPPLTNWLFIKSERGYLNPANVPSNSMFQGEVSMEITSASSFGQIKGLKQGGFKVASVL